MARPLTLPELLTTRFPEGTMASIDKVLEAGQDRQDFVRRAVQAEIVRLATRDQATAA